MQINFKKEVYDNHLAPYAPLPQKKVKLNNQEILETDFGRKCGQIERALVDSVVS